MGGIEVAGDHVALSVLFTRCLIGVGGVGRTKPKLHLELPLHRQDRDGIDAEWDLEPQARAHRAHVLPEPLDDTHAFGAHRVDAAGEAGDDEGQDRQRRGATNIEPSGKSAGSGAEGKLTVFSHGG